MNLKVIILAISAVAVGLVELIVGGILPTIAKDLNISIGTAGQLITVYALVYAIAGPVLLVLTSKMERKKVYLVSLLVFIAGNIMTYFSANFTYFMIARVVTAMSTALIVVLSLTIATKVVTPSQQARAVGLVYMGISSSLVLGVPLGILISDAFGWRVIFLIIAILAVGSFILISLFLEKMSGGDAIPLKVQFKALASLKMGSAQLATMFLLAGHYTVYAYLTPYLESNLQLNSTWVSAAYLVFGIAAISGGAVGGILSDKIGAKKSVLIVIGSFAVSLFVLPFSTFSIVLFTPIMIIWAMLSWAITPPQQSYLIQTDPSTADIQQSFNNSAIQVGISIGSAIGGIAMAQGGPVSNLPWIGSIVAIIALLCAMFSFSRPFISGESEQEKVQGRIKTEKA
ncbi:MFS transporter [Sporosarcina pasteurii]|uniref:Purine efflux pump PbuE n=1 Tax=Sporosarcina pasteurii TaxID=1474 RepID=A0A380C7N9_SPOPA|nr:MFS transporter [Sporosarcina pasteurii]MDS9472971.1 MFS transporter [Sporosarcina pasteurii]QBQ04487.1 MFS transporter [Sporosarcina pasteurii]SUJ14534.1 Purine efflux pump PbuE [Sporosarcina pasteurii]